MAEPSIAARLVHATPRRLRAVMDTVPPRPALDALAAALAALPGIDAVEIRPATGSVILRHAGGFDRGALAGAGLALAAAPAPGPAASADPVAAAARAVAALDGEVRRLSSGQADLAGLAFMGLVAAGLVQLARGEVFGPATTLFAQAAELGRARLLSSLFRR